MYKNLHSQIGRLLIVTFVFTLFPAIGQAQTADQVNRAIDRGVEFLKSRQRANGSWDEMSDWNGGITALVTLALLSCDEHAEGDRIQRALKVVRSIPPRHTYVVSLQTMVLAAANEKEDFPQIRANARWLMARRVRDGEWNYGTRGRPDNSNTQFALLGLWAASEAGVSIPENFWRECRDYWLKTQNGAGGWGYQPGSGPSGSMTAAGISSLKITGRQVNSVRRGLADGKPVRCAGAVEDPKLRAAIDWIGNFFLTPRGGLNPNPGGENPWLYYYLYGIERAGRLTGERFFKGHDWYRVGTRFLTARQHADGSWEHSRLPASTYYNTAFALLFLSKGRIPILVNKLKYGRDADWNNAPNDVHNLTQFIAAYWKTKLNWQIVDVGVAQVEDLLQAPVLQFSGHEAPRFSERDKRLLREYVEQGGLIMVDANCSVESFDDGFRNLCRELFPEPGLELRRLDSSHGVWMSQFDLRSLAQDWPLYGIDLGCRTALIYSAHDLSCQWEYDEELTDPRSAAVPAFKLGMNIVAYATGPEDLQDKLDKRKVFTDVAEDEVERNYLRIAKIRHNGDWNPAPRAIRNLMASLHEVTKINVVRMQRDVEILDPNLTSYPISYMHGRNRISLSLMERKRLAEYFELGGTLFADACCGSERFDAAFRELVKQLFPDKSLDPIPLDHELFSREIGYDIHEVKYSKALDGRVGAPVLYGIELDGRYAIIYSVNDIGCALERQQGSDCKGYSHESALKIASNIVLYAMKQ